MSAPAHRLPADALPADQFLRERAYRDGFRAGRAGLALDTNPYAQMPRTLTSDAQRACWALGWTTAQRGP